MRGRRFYCIRRFAAPPGSFEAACCCRSAHRMRPLALGHGLDGKKALLRVKNVTISSRAGGRPADRATDRAVRLKNNLSQVGLQVGFGFLDR